MYLGLIGYRLIPLRDRSGNVLNYSVVDEIDGWIADRRCHWHLRTYAAFHPERGRGHRTAFVHRTILGLVPGDGLEGDHLNGNKLDNRRCNLRVCTRQQNGQNIVRRAGSSAYRGVTWNKNAGKWLAQITIQGRNIYLGLFDDESTAAEAARIAREEHFTHANEERR